ncbi:MAG: glucose-6-phosphate isomerase [Oscillospiraceae bacterium]|jgi:glucose-6-phosphate isomerase|nr:glucose-6-phosphate isomerase [Oscillospiraceae bacterium]
MAVKLNEKYLKTFIRAHEMQGMEGVVALAHKQLNEKTGLGSDFLGWLDLPENYDRDEFARIKKAAEKITADSEVLIVIGIGGSYLGARAAIEALRSPLYNSLKKQTPEIYFAGNSISPTYLNELISIVDGRSFSVNVISKSGTTTEPALAFRVFRDLLEKKYGEQGAKDRIYATTDAKRGTLKKLADRQGYKTFVIADDVGGRFSVLSAVGLLPIACAGCDIDALMKGAADAVSEYANPDLTQNPCYRYAALRNIFYRKGRKAEMLVAYENSFAMMNEWYKQLYGESEGKDKKGLLPVSAIFSTDLHSLGQYIQDGSEILFETVIDIQTPQKDFFLEEEAENSDGLNFLANRNMSEVNRKAFEGTVLAHVQGGVPNIVLEIPALNEYELGYLIYFFEKACAISGYILGVNPFDQPGVESYKKNMFALLGKAGYEADRAELEKLLNE